MEATAAAERKPFPGFWIALAMSYYACWSQLAWTLFMERWLPLASALAFAVVVTYPLMGYLALSSVGAGWRKLVGLAGVSRRFVPAVVLLAPVSLVTLTIQAAIVGLVHRGRSQGIWDWHGGVLSASSDLGLLGSLAVVVILMPVSLEWFFRGILQQGLVARLGARWGVLAAAAFYAAVTAGLRTDAWTFTAVFWSTLVAGLAFGWVRQLTGSLWAAAAAHGAASGIHAFLRILGPSVPVPYVSTPGRSVPAPLAAVAIVATAAGVVALAWGARRSAGAAPRERAGGDLLT